MHAHMPPFTRKSEGAPEPAAPVGAISDREAGLRTLKHYLYHAGLIVDQLIASEISITARVPESAMYERVPVRHLLDQIATDRFTRDRDATGA